MLRFTKGIVKSLAVLVLTSALSDRTSDYISQFILPQKLITEAYNKPITEVMTQNFNEFMMLGYIIIIMKLVSLVLFTYLAVLLIQRKKWLL